MSTINRPVGRFFYGLMGASLVCLLPLPVVGKSLPQKSEAGGEWVAVAERVAGNPGPSTVLGRHSDLASLGTRERTSLTVSASVLFGLAGSAANTTAAKSGSGTLVGKGLHSTEGNGSISLTQISDTVFRADGSPAKGTVLIAWPAFTTAGGQVVAAGTLNVQLASNGLFSAGLAPTAGSDPTGLYYRVVYQLNEGASYFQEWSALFVVPGDAGGRICFYYPRLQPSQSTSENRQEWSSPIFNTMLHVSLRALPTTDPNDGESVLCYRSYFPASSAAVY